MPTYVHTAPYDVPVEDVWAWYDSKAFRRIMPEWEGIRPVKAGALVDDATTRFKITLGPLRPTWLRHYGVVSGEVFNDVMEKGPFGAWDHEHRFVSTGSNTSEIRDTIQWKLPLHPLTFWTAPHGEGSHEPDVCLPNPARVQEDLKRIAQYADQPKQRGAGERFNRGSSACNSVHFFKPQDMRLFACCAPPASAQRCGR